MAASGTLCRPLHGATIGLPADSGDQPAPPSKPGQKKAPSPWRGWRLLVVPPLEGPCLVPGSLPFTWESVASVQRVTRKVTRTTRRMGQRAGSPVPPGRSPESQHQPTSAPLGQHSAALCRANAHARVMAGGKPGGGVLAGVGGAPRARHGGISRPPRFLRAGATQRRQAGPHRSHRHAFLPCGRKHGRKFRRGVLRGSRQHRSAWCARGAGVGFCRFSWRARARGIHAAGYLRKLRGSGAHARARHSPNGRLRRA